jgi:Sulfotransferase family
MKTILSDKNILDVNFVLGAPRSGTTLLGNLLGCCDKVVDWIEPNFVWDHYFRDYPDDVRTEKDYNEIVKNQIIRDFRSYQKHYRGKVIIDKTPRHTLKIPFIQKIFPKGKFIHIIRDPRDSVLSFYIKRKLLKDRLGPKNGNIFKSFAEFKDFIHAKKLIRHKIRAVWFETHFSPNKKKHYNSLRWNGNVEEGPRFKKWEEVYNNSSLLEFISHQYLESINAVESAKKNVSESKYYELRYEDLITNTEKEMKDLFNFLEIKLEDNYFDKIPEIKNSNYTKWKKGFSEQELQTLKPILYDKALELNYSDGNDW